MIHITCDAWQASNTDSYYAVTGHRMEETSPGVWVLREALLGFTRMNNAHHGIRLGQTLFKIVEAARLLKSCWFSRQMARVAKIKWDPIERPYQRSPSMLGAGRSYEPYAACVLIQGACRNLPLAQSLLPSLLLLIASQISLNSPAKTLGQGIS
ncbi:hypothetical protein B0H14DRAFT_2570433 [Mycena olivaceomarginata]|nr:hypothetical protein B0H14DRAFT_2570433 [Mycena olivaceomarginata]